MQLSPMNFIPIAGVTPLDGSAFITPQEKYLASKPQQAPAAGGIPGVGGGAAPTSGVPGTEAAQGGMMEAIAKLFASGFLGVPGIGG